MYFYIDGISESTPTEYWNWISYILALPADYFPYRYTGCYDDEIDHSRSPEYGNVAMNVEICLDFCLHYQMRFMALKVFYILTYCCTFTHNSTHKIFKLMVVHAALIITSPDHWKLGYGMNPFVISEQDLLLLWWCVWPVCRNSKRMFRTLSRGPPPGTSDHFLTPLVVCTLWLTIYRMGVNFKI